MMKSRFLEWKEIQFRRSRWLSEVLAHKKFSKREFTQQGIVEEDLLWSGKGASHLQENLKYILSVVDQKQLIMWRC